MREWLIHLGYMLAGAFSFYMGYLVAERRKDRK